MDLVLEIQKTNVRIRISILEILCVPFSGKMDNFAHIYMQYFGSNNVEGVAESWVEAPKIN